MVGLSVVGIICAFGFLINFIRLCDKINSQGEKLPQYLLYSLHHKKTTMKILFILCASLSFANLFLLKQIS